MLEAAQPVAGEAPDIARPIRTRVSRCHGRQQRAANQDRDFTATALQADVARPQVLVTQNIRQALVDAIEALLRRHPGGRSAHDEAVFVRDDAALRHGILPLGRRRPTDHERQKRRNTQSKPDLPHILCLLGRRRGMDNIQLLPTHPAAQTLGSEKKASSPTGPSKTRGTVPMARGGRQRDT